MVNVVVGIVERDNKILLIQRERGDFIGLWGIPGGKVEECEHIDKAIEREMLEEIGIKMNFERILGFATEIMHDKNSTSIIYVCSLILEEDEIIQNSEFRYKWFSLEEILNSDEIIESDKVFIEKFYINKSDEYLKLDCYKDNNGNYYWK